MTVCVGDTFGAESKTIVSAGGVTATFGDDVDVASCRVDKVTH